MANVKVDDAYRVAVDRAREALQDLSEQHAPAFLRLALHDALTWDSASRTGGANGSIRTEKELAHKGNEGLDEVIQELEGVHSSCAPITYADLYQLAGVVGVEALGGPQIEFRPGRRDSKVSPPEGRLPAFQNCSVGEGPTLLQRLQRAGLSTRQAVALAGAHPLGRWWSVPQTYEELWPRLEGSSPRANRPPPAFDSDIFRDILVDQDPLSKHLTEDPEVRTLMRGYAADPELWLADYAEAFQQLSEAPAGLPPLKKRRGAGAGASEGMLGALPGAVLGAAALAAGLAVAAGVWWVRRGRGGKKAGQGIPSFRS